MNDKDYIASLSDEKAQAEMKKFLYGEFEIQESPIPPRRQILPKAPPSVDKACIAHEEAYKKVFGVVPSGYVYDVDSRMIYVGTESGVSLKRLKELTRMLNARV